MSIPSASTRERRGILVGGNIALQIPIGWVADRLDCHKLLLVCGCGVSR